MKNEFKDILIHAKETLACPICKRKYRLSEIKLQAFFADIYILKVSCYNNHAPITINAIITNKPVGDKILKLVSKIVKESDFDRNKLSKKDITNIKKTIDDFDGDFEKLWKK